MSDFFQNGTVTTLHNLKTRTLESLEAELHQFAEHSPMALILPCLYSELAQDALSDIIDELNGATYLAHVVIDLRLRHKHPHLIACAGHTVHLRK
mgnify:CR=1 FL=1